MREQAPARPHERRRQTVSDPRDPEEQHQRDPARPLPDRGAEQARSAGCSWAMVMTLIALTAATMTAAAAKPRRNVRRSVPLVPKASPLIPSHCQISPIPRARPPRPFARRVSEAQIGGRNRTCEEAYGTDARCGSGLCVAAAVLVAPCARAADAGWGAYGGDAGGQRFSPAAADHAGQCRQLTQSLDASRPATWRARATSMQARLVREHADPGRGRLYVCSPFNEVSALDPGTGKQLWRFDPEARTSRSAIPTTMSAAASRYSRTGRIYLNTADRRLIALDAATGKPSRVSATTARSSSRPASSARAAPSASAASTRPRRRSSAMASSSSAPPSTTTRRSMSCAARCMRSMPMTGAPRWSFDPLADQKAPFRGGAANVWAPMSVDERAASSSCRCRAPARISGAACARATATMPIPSWRCMIATGEVAWSFQTTHHDVWDYDIPAQPTLGIVTYKGKTRAGGACSRPSRACSSRSTATPARR